MIHRSTIGSLERVFAFLTEHFAGAFPTWLAPVQVKLLPVSEKQAEYAAHILSSLKAAGIRAEADYANESLGKKIREAKLEKVPYLLVVGDKEVAARTVSVESRDKGKLDAMPLDAFMEKVTEEIRTRAA
jgi:threonyl-tRNA synthetase